jgi:hypothetical protein
MGSTKSAHVILGVRTEAHQRFAIQRSIAAAVMIPAIHSGDTQAVHVLGINEDRCGADRIMVEGHTLGVLSARHVLSIYVTRETG